MKIKIFSGNCIAEVEKKVNRFIDDKHVVGIKQSVCCDECKENKKVDRIIITVMYYDYYHNSYCDISFK